VSEDDGQDTAQVEGGEINVFHHCEPLNFMNRWIMPLAKAGTVIGLGALLLYFYPDSHGSSSLKKTAEFIGKEIVGTGDTTQMRRQAKGIVAAMKDMKGA
jgi:hypothetical protein